MDQAPLVRTGQEGHDIVLTVAGELDVESLPELEHRITELEGDTTCTTLVVDISEVTFLGSTAINALLRMQRRFADAQRQLLLRNPHPQVLRVLDIAGVSEMLLAPG